MQASPVAAKWFMIVHMKTTQTASKQNQNREKEKEKRARAGETTLGNLNEALRGN